MKLFGKDMNRQEFYRYFGDVSQVGGVKSYTLNSGKANGVRVLEVNTGAGLRFTVLLDRCMDIGWADFKGTPLNFISKAGISSSMYYEHRSDELHRVFGPGLLTTCGLRNLGAPCVVDGEEFAQHGRIHNAPAENVSVFADWVGDEYKIVIRGQMREAVLYNENLYLVRTIETALGETTFTVKDEIRNFSFRNEPVCILYHCNFGYPIVSEDATVFYPPADIVNEPLDWRPARWSAELGKLEAPQTASKGGFRLRFDDEDIRIGIRNETLEGFNGIYMQYKKSQLPYYGMWRNLVQGDYVVGLEPGTSSTDGRKKNLAKNALKVLSPMESMQMELTFGILTE